VIVVLLNTAGSISELVEEALVHAEQLDTELRAFLLEDSRLYHMAELPFAREVVRQSGQVRHVQPADIEKQMQQSIGRLKQFMTRMTGQRNIRWQAELLRRESIQQLFSSIQMEFTYIAATEDIAGLGVSYRGMAQRSYAAAICYDPDVDMGKLVRAAYENASRSNKRILLLMQRSHKEKWHQLQDMLPIEIVTITDVIYVDDFSWPTLSAIVRKSMVDRLYTTIGSEYFNACLSDIQNGTTCPMVAVS
jgi:hypothetical protein